jgi:hypothetical protein
MEGTMGKYKLDDLSDLVPIFQQNLVVLLDEVTAAGVGHHE